MIRSINCSLTNLFIFGNLIEKLLFKIYVFFIYLKVHDSKLYISLNYNQIKILEDIYNYFKIKYNNCIIFPNNWWATLMHI